jgi:type IV secretory pathway VirB3-like protein
MFNVQKTNDNNTVRQRFTLFLFILIWSDKIFNLVISTIYAVKYLNLKRDQNYPASLMQEIGATM